MSSDLRVGFAKVDITPRVGVETCGFGPFRNRHAIAVRDRLWARAMVFELNGQKAALVTCDLIGLSARYTKMVRDELARVSGFAPERVMVHCSHTHSGPTTIDLIGWGDPDAPYREILPWRIVEACLKAEKNLSAARVSLAEVPCEGIAINRCYETGNKVPLDQRLLDDWRPEKPELTDTTCRVLKFENADDGRLVGFASYFGCHPVVCCEQTHYIHGDYPGVATNLIEREYPGSVGLFLQGAQGDINTCIVHWTEQDSLLALDVIAGRYARSVRMGLTRATPIEIDGVGALSREIAFSRKRPTLEELETRLRSYEEAFRAPNASDQDQNLRMNVVYAVALRNIIREIKAGKTLEVPTEIQGIRLGPIHFLGTPFEIMRAIKNEVVAASGAPCPLVMGLTNDFLGYAPDRERAKLETDYASNTVPFMLGTLPFANVHEELRDALVDIDKTLKKKD